MVLTNSSIPVSPWIKEWNELIRRVIYPDEQLRELMMLPEGTDIITFIERYFIRADATDKLLTNENVRIVYGKVRQDPTDVPNVTDATWSFDIFVKREHQRDASADRLLYRTQLIAHRLIQLLNKKQYPGIGIKFKRPKEGDLNTRTIGYDRYYVSFHVFETY